MKKLLPFAGFCATVLGIIALILVMATPAVAEGSDFNVSGILGIFGGDISGSAVLILAFAASKLNGTALAIIAFILLIIGIVLACAASLLPLLKKFVNLAGWFGLIACACLIVGGILLFFEVPAFYGAQPGPAVSQKDLSLGGGWVTAGILAIVGGGVAFLPSLFAFLAKKK